MTYAFSDTGNRSLGHHIHSYLYPMGNYGICDSHSYETDTGLLLVVNGRLTKDCNNQQYIDEIGRFSQCH